ncbi:MAG TPA: transporter substrate-binding domain-containing protein [Desulfomonilaceae bacterium]|nr:transporter substrate-binding domain-containing protein [Desulfomonilaceae bacterium]
MAGRFRRRSSWRSVRLFAPLVRRCAHVLVIVFVGLAGVSCQPPSDKGISDRKIVPATEKATEKKDGTLQEIKKRGELRVGMQVGYVPFQMLGNQGNLVGLDVDLAEMVAADLKVGLRIVRQSWQGLLSSLLEGQTDVVISAMTVTPERNSEVMFTQPVLETGRMFAVHTSNSERFRSIEDLNQPGIFVVSPPGGTGSVRLRELLPKASHREFPDRKRALAEVLEKRAQAFIDDEFSIRMACAAHSHLLTSRFKPINYESIAWAVRPDDFHWLNWLNNFILRAQGDGRLDELKKKWLQDYFFDTRIPASR